MTVQELIDLLKQENPDAPVICDCVEIEHVDADIYGRVELT